MDGISTRRSNRKMSFQNSFFQLLILQSQHEDNLNIYDNFNYLFNTLCFKMQQNMQMYFTNL